MRLAVELAPYNTQDIKAIAAEMFSNGDCGSASAAQIIHQQNRLMTWFMPKFPVDSGHIQPKKLEACVQQWTSNGRYDDDDTHSERAVVKTSLFYDVGRTDGLKEGLSSFVRFWDHVIWAFFNLFLVISRISFFCTELHSPSLVFIWSE